MAPPKEKCKRSSCATEKQNANKKDVANLCQNWRKFYEQHIRVSQNEWLLEDMAWHCDELNKVLYSQWKAGLICKEAYQDCMAIAWEQWSDLTLMCRDAEEKATDS